jgi:allophanate hydrolase
VAAGLVTFALGTDTAGSGRVPAGFCNLVGVKPSLGRISTAGVVPACRTLDCVSIFAQCCADGEAVLAVMTGVDPADPYSRIVEELPAGPPRRLGIPLPDQREFAGDTAYAALFEAALERFRALGTELVEIDFAQFFETAALLYEGPWVAERYHAIRDFIEQQPASLHPVTRRIIGAGAALSAVAAFDGLYRLQALKRRTAPVFEAVDALLVPTAPTIWRHEEVEADPIGANSLLGTYTNFVNLLDLSALAIPAGFRPDGLPFGVTLIGRADAERALSALGRRFLGEPEAASTPAPSGRIELAVCGAHMSGLPLNAELLALGGRLMEVAATSPDYRFYALPGGPPERPGLVRMAEGAAIEVELWSLPAARLGTLIQAVPAPLGIGRIELADGRTPLGFLCEAHAAKGAVDITAHGGWRRYLDSLTPAVNAGIAS